MTDAHAVTPNLETLVALFYRDVAQLGRFVETTSRDLERDYRMLLAHDSHMTVTVERFHNCPVDVKVLQTQLSGSHYARNILLARSTDGVIVQYGIMRLDLSRVNDAVRRDIESQKIPLGRILISHNVLRKVQLFKLWRVEPGEELRGHFGMVPGQATFGRTAIIECDGEPAVELLEIVAPV